MLEGIIMSFVSTTLYVIEVLGLILSPILAVAPYVILVVGCVWGFWLLAYFFTDLFMEILYLIIQFQTMFINMYIYIYNTMAPIILPPLYSVWNQIMTIVLGWLLAEASVFCPCIGTTCSFPPPLSDLSQDCGPLMKAFNTVQDIFMTATNIFATTFKAIAAALGNLKTTMCTPGSGHSSSSGCSLLNKHYHHLSAADQATTKASANAAFSQAITLIINIIAAVLIDIVLPIVMLFIAFSIDMCVVTLKLFITLILDLGGIFVNMLTNVMVMMGGASENDTFTASSFLQGIGSAPPFLSKTPGPQFLKSILLVTQQVYTETVNAVFNIVYSFLLLVDKSICTLLRPVPCIVGEALRTAATLVRKWHGIGSNMIASALDSAANHLGLCPCVKCAVQSSVIASLFISTSGCNPSVSDSSGDLCAPSNQPCACCPLPKDIPSLMRLLFGGENDPHTNPLYNASNNITQNS